jgi:hypothetical protein
MLLETQSGQRLSNRGMPPGTLDRGPRSLCRDNERCGKARQAVKSCLPVLNRRVEN